MTLNPIARATGVVSIDNGSGTLIDISDQAASFQISSIETNNSTFYTMGDEWAHAVAGKRSWRATIRFYRTMESDEAYQVLRDWLTGSGRPTARTLQIDSPDAEAGSERWTGEVIPVSMTPFLEGDAASTEPQIVTLELLGHGAPTLSTISV